MTKDSVKVESRDQICIVTIDRPARRNAIDQATADRLADAFAAFDGDESLAVAVLTGAGGQFCAGADLHRIAASGDAAALLDRPQAPLGVSNLLLQKPVIAAVEGYAVAGGLELALWCDLRVAARSAVFGVFCRRWGVPLVDGGTVRLPRLIGQSRALDMILTGRAVGGEEAYAIGLCNRLTDDGAALSTAVALARQLAKFPQGCMRSDRLSAIEQWGLPLDAALLNENRRGLTVVQSGESAAGAARFAAGRGRHGNFDDL